MNRKKHEGTATLSLEDYNDIQEKLTLLEKYEGNKHKEAHAKKLENQLEVLKENYDNQVIRVMYDRYDPFNTSNSIYIDKADYEHDLVKDMTLKSFIKIKLSKRKK